MMETLLHVQGDAAPPHTGATPLSVASNNVDRGKGDYQGYARDIAFNGLQLGETLPTYMQAYEPTAGGDWAVQ